jgi:AraC-like DNA-binding protein
MLQHLAVVEDSGRRLWHRPGVGAAAMIVQNARLDIPHLSIDRPGILFITHGRKHVRGDGKSYVFEAGTIVLMAGGRAYDVINEPGADGVYRAEGLFPDSDHLPPLAAPGTKAVSGIFQIAAPADGLTAAIRTAADAISNTALPQAVARHRVHEIHHWLAATGVSLMAPRRDSIDAKVRALAASSPARHWTAAAVAGQLAMSEATLRRRLAEKGTTLSDLLLDVRMSVALSLLQTTDDGITSIALAVGYESPSRFAARFRERFGFAPSEIRQHRAH